MHLRTIISILLTFLFAQMALPQSYFELYKNHIPEDIKKYPRYTGGVNALLKKYAELDPSLIYYYLTQIHFKFDKEIANPDSNFTNHLQYYLAKAQKGRIEWAKTNIALARENITLKIEADRVASYIKPYTSAKINEVYAPQPASINTNKQDFFRYILFKDEPGLTYNADKNYEKLCNALVQEKVNTFNQQIKDIHTLSSEDKQQLLRSASKFTYLFKHSYLDDYPYLTDYAFYEIYEKLVKKDYQNYYGIIAQVSYSVLPVDFKEQFQFTDPFNQSFQYNYEVQAQNALFLSGGVRIKLKPLLTPFSSINVQFGYAVAQSLSNNLKRHVFFDGFKAVEGFSFNGSYYITDYRNLEGERFMYQISVPFIYFDRHFSVEAGFHYQQQNISFEYDFIKAGQINNPYGGEIPEEFFDNETIEYNKTKHLFYPVLGVNYAPARNINFKFEYLIPNQVVINTSFLVDF
ncbi:MAG: hypothetical protein GF313_00440 [Caldithrix sp.]|nr:hypothetical protein [Caldithrix sp.]